MSGKKYCFRHTTGEDIYLYKLANAAGTEVLISNYGGIINSFKVRARDGKFTDIVLGLDEIKDYLTPAYFSQYPYFGAAIGRYGNRIRDARFTIDGKEYRPSANINGNCLHGGFEGFDKKAWKEKSFDEKKASLILHYKSIDGEEGFPGNLGTDLHFQLTDENELKFNYRATTDKPTALNLTHHSYFNLNPGHENILDHYLKINSSFYLEQDEELCATGELVPVEHSMHDFRSFRKIGEFMEPGGFDQSFVVKMEEKQAANPPLSLMAEAYSEVSGIKLQVWSTEPIVHLYTGQGIGSMRGKNNLTYGPFSGFCLETQKHPNAINIPHFPNTILRPLETYVQETIYRVMLL